MARRNLEQCARTLLKFDDAINFGKEQLRQVAGIKRVVSYKNRPVIDKCLVRSRSAVFLKRQVFDNPTVCCQ
jgi:hypothetical protein